MKWRTCCLLTVVCVILMLHCCCFNVSRAAPPPERNILKKGMNSTRDTLLFLLLNNYKAHERPTELTGGATNVTVFIKILAINSVDVRNMEYSADMYLRQLWVDPRLAWNNIEEYRSYNSNIVSVYVKEYIWLPDLFFRNGKHGYLHKMTLENYLLRLQPNGEVLYSQKITMRYSCPMELSTFPMDSQTCGINIGSYGYTLDQLKFIWRSEDAVSMDPTMQISEFNTPEKVLTHDCTAGYSTATGSYTCLNASFVLQRQLGYYLSSTYIPSILIVMVSWLNFWVSIDAVPARVPLGLLTLLAILTQASTVSSSLPRVSYIKAIDIWTIACIVFVTSAFIEFAVANTLSRKRKQDNWKNEIREVVRQELANWCRACKEQHQDSIRKRYTADRGQMELYQELETLLTQPLPLQYTVPKNLTTVGVKNKSLSSTGSEIDTYSRFMFPMAFGLFNTFYWVYYLYMVE